VQYTQFLTCLGGGEEEGATKLSQNAESFAESIAKILAKFHELKISKKTQDYQAYFLMHLLF